MDALSAVLAAQRAEGAFVLRSDLVAPWAIRIEDAAPLTTLVVLAGHAVLTLDELSYSLAPGYAALVRGETPYTVASSAAISPQARIGPGQVCTRPDGSPLSQFRTLGTRVWGNAPPGRPVETVLLTATYTEANKASARVLEHLPSVVVLSAAEASDEQLHHVVDLLARELGGSQPGQDVLIDRLVDILTVCILRSWPESAGVGSPRWLAAQAVPVVGDALRRIHHEPGRPWTLGSLAHDVGVSRATLARRFSQAVGEPVMTYLCKWRMDLAADLLAGTDDTVESIARQVGYGSAFALSNAFKRQTGQGPAAYRRMSRVGTPPEPRRGGRQR